MDGLTIGSILAGILATFIATRLEHAGRWLRKYHYTQRMAFHTVNNFYYRSFCIAALSMVSALGTKIFDDQLSGFYVNPLFIGISIYAVAQTNFLWQFAKIGLHTAQSQVSSGTDYKSSLDLCQNCFSFLGTGASKLTNAENFEQTVIRCSASNSTLRFLLSKPDNAIISKAERNAGVATNQYSFTIKRSLKKIKVLHDERGAKIEVRFYPPTSDFEKFRMMFIDDNLLLLSYNVYGRGSGSDLPQLIIRKSPSLPAVSGFYASYKSYFDHLWQISEPWDFVSHAEE